MPKGPRLKLPADAISKIENMGAAGLTMFQIGMLLGMSKKTIERRLSENKQALDALERGRAKALYNVGSFAYQKAIGGNIAMMIFYLKCRGHWKESHHVEHTGVNGAPLVPDNKGNLMIDLLKDPEAFAAIEVLEKKLNGPAGDK
jgi:hypothetical protein